MAIIDPDEHVQENYRQIRHERDCSWADLARDMDESDPRLAAWMRREDARENAHADVDAAEARSRAPRGRRSAVQPQA